MSPRTDLVTQLVDLVGASLEIESLGSGWPSLATLHIDGEDLKLALFVSPVGLSHRGRDSVERRFQNPGSNTPIKGVPGYESVLLGIWQSDSVLEVAQPVIAMAEAHRRDDGRVTRWSVFLLMSALMEASEIGWSTDVTDSGEVIRYFYPTMFPVAITASMTGAEPEARAIYKAIWSTSVPHPNSGVSEAVDAERTRRTVTALVRDSKFSGSILNAYGRLCAMCGLGLSLVQGAHIYPASAPGSLDEVPNGLALCANHHLAFDKHLIAVHADSLEIRFHPSVLELAKFDSPVSIFVVNTFAILRGAGGSEAPDPEAFRKRYHYYSEHYSWINAK